MCYNCGCGELDDSMGHPENITTKTFSDAANAERQDVLVAKLETYKALRKELKKAGKIK